MEKSSRPAETPIGLFRSTLNTLFSHPIIFLPFICIAFIETLFLELFFFAARHPLSKFFGPIIARTEGDIFLHYPFNLTVLTKWFQNTVFQSVVFVVFSSLFIGAAVAVINSINNERPVVLKAAFKRSLSSYVHLFFAALFVVLSMVGLSWLHRLVIQRALAIRSAEGIFFILKKAVVLSAPYVNLIIAVFVTTLFIYVLPIIILEKKKIFAALRENFRLLCRSFWLIFIVMLLPALLYVPVLLVRSGHALYEQNVFPEFWPLFALAGVFLSLFIDAIQYTAVTTFYLLKSEGT